MNASGEQATNRVQAMPSGQRIRTSSSRHFSFDPNRSINETRFIAAMTQTPRKVRKRRPRPDETDHDMMERLFGKRIMKEVDRVVSERSQVTEKSGRFEFMKKS